MFIHLARRWLAGALIAGALLAGCTATSQPTPRADGVILQDDFADPQSGWDRHAGAEITTDYAAGRYLIAVASPNLEAWGLAGLDLNDMRVQAEAVRADGPADNAFGLICRHTRTGDQNNFYFFLISSDGYYAAGKVVKDQRTYLNPAGDFEPLAAIRTEPDAVNTLEAVCRGDQLSFTVNGTPAGAFSDGELTHGDVGLLAGTFNEGGVQIAFDNAVVRQP
ncbi:MAG: hypothetical protein JNK29_07170 [Anaerolineales bacterium]|nr:hypothetical protein [Anaerolineales bacterium]